MKEHIIKEFKCKGFYSEYLPPCFKLDETVFNYCPKEKCDLIEPLSFTMSRFNEKHGRRTIYIPEIGSYIVMANYIIENDILEELIDFVEENSNSYSKILDANGSFLKHERMYSSIKGKINSNYIDNIKEKIIKATGAEKILILDIANCYASVYTHFLPSILLGYNEANNNYVKLDKNRHSEKEEEISPIFKKYFNLDKIVRRMNSKRTNGLLVGPLISTILVEAMLTRIDMELEQKGISFSRYMDDYEVYLINDDIKQVVNVFTEILNKYGFSLNAMKTEVKSFPFYMVENFDKIIEYYRENMTSDFDIIELFNKFIKMEKEGTKGAIRYLLKTLEDKPIKIKNQDLYNSYIISIMLHDDRSLIKACSLIIEQNKFNKVNKEMINKIKELLLINVHKGYDLEVLWLLYVLIETENANQHDSYIEEIVSSSNELAILMLIRYGLIDIKKEGIIKEKARSWLLNYELFALNVLEEKVFFDRMDINKNKDMYIKLKANNVHFCLTN